MKRTLITLIILFTGSILTGYAALFYLNNRAAHWPERARIQASYNAAIGWIEAHQEDTLSEEPSGALVG